MAGAQCGQPRCVPRLRPSAAHVGAAQNEMTAPSPASRRQPASHPAQTLAHHSGQLHPARQPAPSSRTGAAPALAPPSATSPSPALRSPAAGQRQRAGAGAHSAAPQPPPSACDLALHLASRQQQQPCGHLPAPSAVHSALGARPLQTTRATTVPTPSRLKASTVEVSNKSTRLKSGGQDT